MSIISSETIAWIMFTLPIVETEIPVFIDNLILGKPHIIDKLGELLLDIDEFMKTLQD
ncbi:MAG: hypothetical protein Q9M89_10175 [Persephonella sp.]|nr:hypothetical protein [Persephonella sp.]